jgi:hypothetical protein
LIIFGRKQKVKEAVKEVEAYNEKLSKEEDDRRIVTHTLELPGAPNPRLLKALN